VKYEDGEDSGIKGVAKSVHVYVDGCIMSRYPSLPHHTNGAIRGVYVAKDKKRPFLFAEIQTTGQGHPPVLDHSALLALRARIIQMKILHLVKTMQIPTR
jgi:hypothetical protein